MQIDRITPGFRKKACLALAILLMLTSVFTYGAAKTENRRIRIGYIDYDGFITQEADGTCVGYGVELLNEVAKYTGWQYEYVSDSWMNHLENLKTGEIDFICHAQKTEQREADYLFSQYATGAEASVLYVRADNQRYYYNDFEHFKDMRIAFLKGSFQNDAFDAYAATKQISYTPLYYRSEGDAFQALDDGMVDAVAMGSLALKRGYKVACRFGSEPFYFMTGSMNQGLIQAVNGAMEEILGADPHYITDLYEAYYDSADAAQSLNLTREEAEYIAQAGTLAVGQLRNRYPMSNYDEKTARLSGINEDFLQKISQITGLDFSMEPLELNETTSQAIDSGRFQLVMGVMGIRDFWKDADVHLSDPFLESTLAVVARRGMAFDPDTSYTVAMKTAFQALQGYISANYPQYIVHFYTTDEECLQAVLEGSADIMMQNVYVTNYLMQKPQYTSLEILPTTFLTEQDCFLADASVDMRLISILNKAIRMISGEDRDRIILANTTAKPYQLTTEDVLYKYRVPLLVVSMLLLTCLTLLLVLSATRQYNVQVLREKNRQLSEAVAQAERANSAKSQFLSHMSHEIRTPMNAIVGITGIARNHEHEPEKIDDYLDKVDASSRVLLNIINDVLDMSAIESDRLKIASSEFDMKKVLDGITAIYYPQCRQKGIDLQVVVDISNELLVGDSLRVNQILMNLISNAYKFTPSGGTITLSATQTTKRNDDVFLRFVLSDTGCGMAEDMLARLFLPFEQENAAVAQVYGGSGLGMSITKNLVDMMNGAIAVKSAKSVGTTFTVDLPFKLAEREEADKVEALKDIRVLVVDDDPNALEYTTLLLQRLGVQYDAVASGEAALELLQHASAKQKKYDACFIDWKMPGMTGMEVTRGIRKLFDHPMLIIIVTAYDVSEVEEEALAAGADMFVTKPLFQSTVFNMLMQLCGGTCIHRTAQKNGFDLGGIRVLLAEDNALNAEIATELLKEANVCLDWAENGRDAVDMFEGSAPGTYTAILMDVQMPIMDGYEATRMIRASAHPQARTIPIYAMTANAFTEDVSAALSAGMNGHIAKPIDTQLLYTTLAKCR